MKIYKSIQIGEVIILFFLIHSVFSCPKCNQDFYNQLMSPRANTLGGKELLEAIKNQTIPGEPSPFVLPATYNSQTDIKSDIEDSTDVADNDNHGSSFAAYFTYAFIFVHLTFIEGF